MRALRRLEDLGSSRRSTRLNAVMRVSSGKRSFQIPLQQWEERGWALRCLSETMTAIRPYVHSLPEAPRPMMFVIYMRCTRTAIAEEMDTLVAR